MGQIGITNSDEIIEKTVKVSERGLRLNFLVVALMQSSEVLLSTIDDILCCSGEIRLHILLLGVVVHRRRIECIRNCEMKLTRKM